MGLSVYLALALSFVGCAGLYLSSRHQSLLAKPLPARPARWAGGLLGAVSLPLLCASFSAVVAVFVLSAWVTLLLMVLPYAAALISVLGRGARRETA